MAFYYLLKALDLPPGSEIIVQVTKGPIGTKGPRVTTNVVLPGRYLVLLPNSDQSGISRKIENQEERKRLKKILRELSLPEGMGVIMRTAGEGQQLRHFVRDLAFLVEEWNAVQERMKKQPPATCVFEEPDLIERTVRDFLTEDVERIVVDNPKACDRMRAMISKISQRSAKKIVPYIEAQPIFDRFLVSKQLENAFSRQVNLKSGGAIVIDETEALVAIDVNTGRHKGSKDQESTILKVNQEAADEICRQHVDLTLPQVHAALGYYFENRPECDRQIEESLKRAEEICSRRENIVLLAQLRNGQRR